MGYTHYLEKVADAFTPATFLLLQAMVGEIIEKAHAFDSEIIIETFDQPNTIWFNGSPEGEDFYLQPTSNQEELVFCKTNRQPYDTVVVASLIAATLVTGDKLEFKSDGNIAELNDGLTLFQECWPMYATWGLKEGENSQINLVAPSAR